MLSSQSIEPCHFQIFRDFILSKKREITEFESKNLKLYLYKHNHLIESQRAKV